MAVSEDSDGAVVVVSEAGNETSDFTVQVHFTNGGRADSDVIDLPARDGEEDGDPESTIFRGEDPDSVSDIERET